MSDAPVDCWSCAVALPLVAPFCTTCHLVQPPRSANAFLMFGLSTCFTVDRAQLDAAYFLKQARVHPDQFVKKAPLEQLYALQQSAALNTAYATLKTPVLRAVHLLQLAGYSDALNARVAPDPGVLMAVMMYQERLEACASAGAVDVQQEIGREIHEIHAALVSVWDFGSDLSENEIDRALTQTQRLQYMEKLLQHCTQRMATLGENTV